MNRKLFEHVSAKEQPMRNLPSFPGWYSTKAKAIHAPLFFCEYQYGLDLLKKRRSALVSAAITGKIVVREIKTSLT